MCAKSQHPKYELENYRKKHVEMSGGIITIREEMPYGKSQMFLKELNRRTSSLFDIAKTTTEIQALGISNMRWTSS